MKNIYCIVGPSGSGKTTVAEALEKEYGWVTIESYTTRPPRYEGETGHIFVTEEEFRALGEMCAYTKFDGYEYGVTPDIVERSDLYVIDPAGLELFREKYHGEKGIQVIGLSVPVEELRRRMLLRGDSDEKITRRLANDAVVFRDLEAISDIYIDAMGSVAGVCELVHQFISFQESNFKKGEKTMLDISMIAYELYKQDWVDEHTTREERLQSIREYHEYVQECAEDGFEADSYGDWLFENGYHGALYVCYDEFCDMEYHDVGYIKSLLGGDEALLNRYFEDIDVAYEESEDLSVVADVLSKAESRCVMCAAQESTEYEQVLD